RATADIEKVSGFAPVKFDDVHCSHGKARAIDEAGYVAVETDVIESMFRRFDLARVFLSYVTHRSDFRMPIQCVVVKIKLGIKREDFAFGGNDQWVDLHHRAIVRNESAIKSFE